MTGALANSQQRVDATGWIEEADADVAKITMLRVHETNVGNGFQSSMTTDRGPGRSAIRQAEIGTAQLWSAFWSTRDVETRNELILSYRGVVDSVVARLPISFRANWERTDLHSFGMLGLIDAIENFRSSSEPQMFESYARFRVRGAIFDELRRLDWLPRSVRRRTIEYRATSEELSGRLGRDVEANEVIDAMGLHPAAAETVRREVQSAQLLHLGQVADEFAAVDESPLPEELALSAESLRELRGELERLPERQRTVLSLRYFGGLSQAEVGAMLGVTNSRICQIESSAIDALRRSMCA